MRDRPPTKLMTSRDIISPLPIIIFYVPTYNICFWLWKHIFTRCITLNVLSLYSDVGTGGCWSFIAALSGKTCSTVSRDCCGISDTNLMIMLVLFTPSILELESCGFLHYNLQYLCHLVNCSVFQILISFCGVGGLLKNEDFLNLRVNISKIKVKSRFQTNNVLDKGLNNVIEQSSALNLQNWRSL